jgi:signal transduction histidine kinase
MLGVMLVIPEEQTIPYHFIFVGFTLLYGFRLWSPAVTVAVLALVTVTTGALFLTVYLEGRVAANELAEVPLMPAIVGAMAWHAQRRAAAQHRMEELVALESSRLMRQREFLRDASHSIRTPVTIARGHVELLIPGLTDAESRADADEVLRQLERIDHLAGRLLSIEQLQDAGELQRAVLDASSLVEAAGRRWSHSIPRRWSVEARQPCPVIADERRLDEALDALVKNALRFTGPQDPIRLSCRREAQAVLIEVADGGPGIPAEDRERVFDRFFHRHPAGEEPGTGLGLALVRAIARAHGGDAEATEAPEGGALLRIRLPLAVATTAPPPRSHAERSEREGRMTPTG